MLLTDDQLQRFRRRGYLRLGRLLTGEELNALRTRIDEIMLGTAPAPYDRMSMQLDPATDPPEHKTRTATGHKGATLTYRKIQELELDPLFCAYLQRPLFAALCRRVYGEGRAITCFRAMFMNKPAGAGTDLVWHQDRWTDLDRDPQITVWTALDAASIGNGCVQIIPGSHRRLRNPSHGAGFLSDEQRAELNRLIEAGDPEHRPVHLELDAGEVVLLHNWTLHRSGTNATDTPRRAFSVCYMDAATRSARGQSFSLIFDRDGQAVPSAA